MPLRIVIVSAFYSEGMGYSENCLARALARLGHEVHVVTSTYNVYGNEPLYDATYASFLGSAEVAPGTREVDGYQVHRLPSHLLAGYVRLRGLGATIRGLRPDVVHSLEIGSLQTWELALGRIAGDYRLFTETHQNMSVVRSYMRDPNGPFLKRLGYRLTRTLPTALASRAVERCYAVAPDCREVATRFYGVPASKVKVVSLGADTDVFHPVEDDEDAARRDELRAKLGFGPTDIVAVYTGRFSPAKNPLVLAKAIEKLGGTDPRFKALFIGEGAQRDAIAQTPNAVVLPFMTHRSLADHYRAADLGVWPRQESMSMIDAAAAGLPVIVSERVGEPERVAGNGRLYVEDDVDSLADAIWSLVDPEERKRCGAIGRRKTLAGFNWARFAEALAEDFRQAVRER